MMKKRFIPCGGGAVILKGQKVLLVKEKTSDHLTQKRAGQWSIPGGRLEDSQENLINLVKREVQEETGYEIQPTALLGFYQTKVVGLVIRAKITGKTGSFDNREIAETRFFLKEEIEKMREEEFRLGHRFLLLKDAFNQKRSFPLSFYRFLGKPRRK